MSADPVPSDAHIPPRSATRPSENPTKGEPHKNEQEGELHNEDTESSRDLINEKNHDKEETKKDEAPPLPDEEAPPLPDEAPPGEDAADDGWEPVWDGNAQAYYFYNRITGVSQWENPRVPEAAAGPASASALTSASTSEPRPPGVDAPSPPAARAPAVLGGYNPAIHGDYDPTAPYAQQYEQAQQGGGAATEDPSQLYAATGAFNRFTGKWQDASIRPENYNDENKSRRQMHAFFDVDAAANSHNGRSLKAERSGKKLSKAEVKAFREKRRERKEEKRRAWLRD